MIQKENINAPDCEPILIGLSYKPHDGAFIFNIMKKKCTVCGIEKNLNEFYSDKRNVSGIAGCCKMCKDENRRTYLKTKAGIITRIYGAQISTSKRRGHPQPAYTKEQFSDFCYASPMFHELYNNWVKSGYYTWLVPTFDRKDDYKGYSFENFNKWMTRKENTNKYFEEVKGGSNTKTCKAVIATNKTTKESIEFYSMSEAYRKTGVRHPSISACCNGKYRYNSAGGYTWKFKTTK